MAHLSAKKIVDNALEKYELDLLLLGRPEYQCFGMWSSSPYNTDLALLLDTLYQLIEDDQESRVRSGLLSAINKIVGTYEGLIPVAGCILFESGRRSDKRPMLGLPLESIAAELRQSIRVFRFRLEEDRTGVGAEWPDGLFGDLRRLSSNTEEVGGPSFCE